MFFEIGLLKAYSFRNVRMKSNPLMLQGYFDPESWSMSARIQWGRLGPYQGVQLQAVDIRESIKWRKQSESTSLIWALIEAISLVYSSICLQYTSDS